MFLLSPLVKNSFDLSHLPSPYEGLVSSVTGRGEFTFHVWILGPSEVCAVSWGKFTFLFGFWV